MSDHTTVFVPIATSIHQSPGLYNKGVSVDTGLFAEALVYYDTVYLQTGTPQHFASFVSLLVQQGLSYEQLIALVVDGTIKFFNTVSVHPFVSRNPLTNTIQSSIIKNLVPIQENSDELPLLFETKYLDSEFLRESFSTFSGLNEELYSKFCEVATKASIVLDGNVIDSGLVDFDARYLSFGRVVDVLRRLRRGCSWS
jgi:hypothetical protein